MTTPVSTVMDSLTAKHKNAISTISVSGNSLSLFPHAPFLSSLFLVSFYVDPADLKFLISLPQPPQRWDYKSVALGLLQSTSG